MNPRLVDWTARRVWLVGASTGIGAALARALVAQGAWVAVSARHAQAAADLPDAVVRLDCDATQVDSLSRARDTLLARWGGIDLVVYLAGAYEPMRAQAFNLDRAEQVVAVNFLGALRTVGTVLPHLPPGGGLVLVSSVAGWRALPKALAYGPGKAALIHLAEGLHLDLAPTGVGVWLVNPGFVATRLTAKNDFRMPALMQPDEAAQALLKGLRSGAFEIHFPRRFTSVLRAVTRLPYRLYFPLIRRITGG